MGFEKVEKFQIEIYKILAVRKLFSMKLKIEVEIFSSQSFTIPTPSILFIKASVSASYEL